MTLSEILLLPLYLFAFHLYFKRKRKRISNAHLRKYHGQALIVKTIGCLLYVYYYTYLTSGDTTSLYFPEGTNLFRLLRADPANWKYFFSSGEDFPEVLVKAPWAHGYYREEGNFMVMRFTAIFSFLTFGQYSLISLFFTAFSFSGLWKLFMFFHQRKPELTKAFAVSILFFPSVIFWSSGLNKESLCMGALGWFTYSLSNLLQRKKIVQSLTVTLLAGHLIIIIKMYILLAFAPFLIMYLFQEQLSVVKNGLLKGFITLAIVTLIVSAFSITFSSYEEEMGRFALENLTSTVSHFNETFASMAGREDAESTFDLGAEYDGTLSGIIRAAPYAVIATFYRPFLWETAKVSQLLAALESLILIFFTLRLIFRTGLWTIIRFAASDSLILFCLAFAFIFALFIGITTLNFGTLVRYKIPCMPFYTIALFLIYEKVKERKASRQNNVEQPLPIPVAVA